MTVGASKDIDVGPRKLVTISGSNQSSRGCANCVFATGTPFRFNVLDGPPFLETPELVG